ncbi:hypothetical protein F3Y22_tig00110547pilonHSYRG00019 [Hibiscus syriacus]|uniref:Uncharacterized protein n=1 Tax=Hibiscus syriacus TaxID=106335 RepID=A0A6A3ABJ0_HIBSY|nr:hypothetical protein F3Y22_tig00110547pilonHSYRG00019 [Hibiscus syriacus]
MNSPRLSSSLLGASISHSTFGSAIAMKMEEIHILRTKPHVLQVLAMEYCAMMHVEKICLVEGAVVPSGGSSGGNWDPWRFKGANPSLTVIDYRTRHVSGTTQIRPHRSLPSETLLYDTDFDIDSDSDIDSSSDDESEYEEPSTSHNRRQVEECFRVRCSGSGHFVCDEWEDSYFSSGKGVRTLAISAPFSSPAVVFSAGVSLSSRRVAVGAWDTRLCRRVPAIVAEWRPKQSPEKITAVNMDDGVEKVYTRGDVTGKLTVSDMRMVISSLRNLTAY